MSMKPDKILATEDRIWDKLDEHTGTLGKHDSRLTSIEKTVGVLQYDTLHWQTNHRAEVNGNIEKFREDSLKYWEKVENHVQDMIKALKIDFFDPLLERVEKIQEQIIPSEDIKEMGRRLGRMEKFMYMVIGGGILVGFLFAAIIQWGALKSFFHG